MKPRAMMWLGFSVGIIGIAGSVFGNPGAVVMVFAGGALFGKGYGVWEVRRAPSKGGET